MVALTWVVGVAAFLLIGQLGRLIRAIESVAAGQVELLKLQRVIIQGQADLAKDLTRVGVALSAKQNDAAVREAARAWAQLAKTVRELRQQLFARATVGRTQ